MKTAFYWPTFLGPLGKQADFWAVVNLLQETLTASDLELFVDTEPTQPALARLVAEIRKGRVNRVIVRSLSDLCVTPAELMQFAVEVTPASVKVEQLFSLLPSSLVWKHPELVGRYRHRQLTAKVLRMRQAGLTINEICSLARASPQQVYRILSRPR
jgi:DNA invertase Pin-like site-specific DNA recombinase